MLCILRALLIGNGGKECKTIEHVIPDADYADLSDDSCRTWILYTPSESKQMYQICQAHNGQKLSSISHVLVWKFLQTIVQFKLCNHVNPLVPSTFNFV